MAGDKSQPHDKKRKRFDNARQQFGSRNKKKEQGRGAWSREKGDKRALIEEQDVKRRKIADETPKDDSKPSVLPGPFSQEEIDKESRKPKHKVAVMIGYSGTGYRGMQINTTERTIEGDLFTAFVHAGAISKANANDPKKSGLVRCARTDKGVHAAGNVVSLKLIIEEPDIVERINAQLSEQIRVWGIQRTVGSFSCYQACDSRWYEYLIPSHAFLPPHPNSFLGRKLVEVAAEVGQADAYKERQEEVSTFWDETEQKYIKPILESIEDDHLKELVMKALYETDEDARDEEGKADNLITGNGASTAQNTTAEDRTAENTERAGSASETTSKAVPTESTVTSERTNDHTPNQQDQPMKGGEVQQTPTQVPAELRRRIETTTRELRAAYTAAKRKYRIPKRRQERVQAALNQFLGTQNFHNYTINKSPRDPSAKRLIKSFKLDPEPKIINGTEWLSMKIHGQSFMMHQIRKMVSAVALVVRCGAVPSLIKDTLSADHSVSVPKAPGLGLLLERPVFESYNNNTATKFDREPISFKKYEKEMEEFKQREIYERIFREEEQGGAFGTFFGHVDGFRENFFLWVTAHGVSAGKRDVAKSRERPVSAAATGANGVVQGQRITSASKADVKPDRQSAAAIDESRRRERAPSASKLGGVDSEDEEDVEEQGRADMDG